MRYKDTCGPNKKLCFLVRVSSVVDSDNSRMVAFSSARFSKMLLESNLSDYLTYAHNLYPKLPCAVKKVHLNFALAINGRQAVKADNLGT